MGTIVEIETAIEHLPTSQLDELAAWLEEHRAHRRAQKTAETWLKQARGAARPGVTTDEVMSMTRGDE